MPKLGRKRRLVIFDIDGVIADFALALSTIASRYFHVLPFSTAEQETFQGLKEHLTKIQINQVRERVDREPGFWKGVPCLLSEYDKRAMYMLSEEGVELVYLTNRPEHNSTSQCMSAQTLDWLYANGIPRGTIVPTLDKATWLADNILANPDMYEVLGVIEDAPRNIAAYRERGVAVTVRDWQFNRDVEPDAPRVSSVVEFCDSILSRIEAEDNE